MESKKRQAGVLLHISSLPSHDGIGDLGDAAYAWVDKLASMGGTIWQILPYNPPGAGESPYMAISSFAGNPLFISLDFLAEQGLLPIDFASQRPYFPQRGVDFFSVKNWKLPLLAEAARNFIQQGGEKTKEFQDFCARNSYWLEDFVLFSTIKYHYDAKAQAEGSPVSSWQEYWPTEYARRNKQALKSFSKEHAEETAITRVLQYFFFTQWKDLHGYAQEQGVAIMGDLPIFPSADSAEVWSHPELFKMDKDLKLTVIAGVPPDYFSPTGQRWGNPHYNWTSMKQDGYRWWVERFKALSFCVDMLRIDHFRGFDEAWEVPGDQPTAEHGTWVAGPRYDFFKIIEKEVPGVEIVAEDLGLMTPGVIKLREQCGYPGMKILQFAFGQNFNGEFQRDDPFLPHNIGENFVAYTGTHDNDTTKGWYNTLSDEVRDLVRRYLGVSGENIVWDLIRAVFQSCAKYAIIPVQDLMELDGSCRMNIPGTAEGNWGWRILPNEIQGWQAHLFGEFCYLYNR